MIEDLILTVASSLFVLADLKQALKLFKNKKYDTSGFSLTHFKLKLISLSLVIVAYLLLGIFFALIVAISQLSINVYLFWRVYKNDTRLV
jgi:uncharacterized protein with PQ loop repeat